MVEAKLIEAEIEKLEQKTEKSGNERIKLKRHLATNYAVHGLILIYFSFIRACFTPEARYLL